MSDLVVMFLKVGAGLPVIASLNRIISSGDPVHRIIGSLSGISSNAIWFYMRDIIFWVLDHTLLVGNLPHNSKVLVILY